jgi:hypothetical protein
MGAFTYVDIFATKGIEYLLIIDFLLIFILFWRILSAPAERLRHEVVAESRRVAAAEDSQWVPEGKLFGPQWAWKWEILRV